MSNAVIEGLKKHRSIRTFLDKEIEKEVLEELIECGIRAATGGNLQAYSFVIIDDKDKLKKLGVPNAPLAIIALADQFRIRRWFEVSGVKECSVNTLHSFYISIWDAIIALHNVVIAAESLELGAYYYGDVTSSNIKEIINNPEYTFPAAMICLGYPSNNGRLSDRLPMEAVVHHNTYKKPSDDDIIEWYKEKDNLFLTRNTKERLEQLKLKNIYNLGQAYASNKFKEEELEELARGIRKNLKQSEFQFGPDVWGELEQ